jgi:hypothetical protein
MKTCSLLHGILCAVPRVGAALRFDGDADAEIEDDADDDRPRVFPRSRQTKSGQWNRGASRHGRLTAVRVLLNVISLSFESELLFALPAPPPIGDQSEEPPPTSNARLEPSRRRLPRFGTMPLRRR